MVNTFAPNRASYRVLRTSRPRTHRVRPGFTLVELLVVITIIIILMGLLTPVVINALAKAKETRIQTEIGMIDGAIKTYKGNFGAYPPSDFSNLGTAAYTAGSPYNPNGFSTNKLTTGTPQFVALANHLQKAFPRCNVSNEIAAIIASNPRYPGNLPAPVSPAQAIVFWLSGFCSDKEHPISGLLTLDPSGSNIVVNLNATRDAGSIEFDKTRFKFLLSDGSWGTPSGSLTALPAAPCYFAADTPGTPYVYFASQNYTSHAGVGYTGPATFGTRGTPYDTAVWHQGGTGILRPYAADPPLSPRSTTAPIPVNPSSFQIISAGVDSDFGGAGTMDNGNSDASNKNPVIAYFNSGTWYATGDSDNLTNFSDKTLGNSIPK